MSGWGDLLTDGLVSRPDALAGVEEAVRPGGERVLVVRVAGGLHVDVLPERGLDLGAAWWTGIPIAWRSPHTGDPGPGHGWEDRFLGGLLATCGPDNIGAPRAGHGQHGTHHLTPAHDVRWWRETVEDGVEVHVHGVVGHSRLYGPWLEVVREVVLGTGRPYVEVRDVVRNRGPEPVAVPLMYHVNLGAPVVRPGTRVDVQAERRRTMASLPSGRDEVTMPAPAEGAEAVVTEHSGLRTAQDRAWATVTGGDVDVVVAWAAETMPRLNTWLWPARGAWVVAVEPSNAPLFGPERDVPGGGAPTLAPGGSWSCGVRIAVAA